ncbi:dihydrolipoamide acetyltransferase family protein [Dactylosporangium sp. CA-233914]|uniref:dihydrolipoamide acetyltransferase family protein n=1 Tax=Dactylosporangium sp. CA-233914 TaxID=3239934 RepID=UPI003D923670
MQAIRLPRLGQTMEAGVIRHWSVAEGDAFAEGDVLYEVETEKANIEVEAKSAGLLARILVSPSDHEIAVGTTLAVVADPGEAVDDAAVARFFGGDQLAAAAVVSAAVVPEAAEAVIPEPSSGRVKAVPKARRVARDLGIDLGALSPADGRDYIRVEDVMAALAPPVAAPQDALAPSAPQRPIDGVAVAARIPLQGVAKAMAETMARTAHEVPQFVQQVSVDAAALAARLKRLRYEGVHVTYTDLLVSALAHSAAEVPEVNSSFGDGEIVRYADVNVAVAMATDRGLVVPVVRQVTGMDIAEVARTTKELAEQARAGRIGLDRLSGGTISLSNLGAFGIDTGFPIVNAPQCALVFVGKLAQEPVVVDGRIEIGTRMQLAIAFDHRVVDGMTAARFTQAFRARIEAGG